MQVGRGFKEEVTSAPNTTMTLRTRDERDGQVLHQGFGRTSRDTPQHPKERGFFGWGNYEETGRATESQDRENAVAG